MRCKNQSTLNNLSLLFLYKWVLHRFQPLCFMFRLPSLGRDVISLKPVHAGSFVVFGKCDGAELIPMFLRCCRPLVAAAEVPERCKVQRGSVR